MSSLRNVQIGLDLDVALFGTGMAPIRSRDRTTKNSENQAAFQWLCVLLADSVEVRRGSRRHGMSCKWSVTSSADSNNDVDDDDDDDDDEHQPSGICEWKKGIFTPIASARFRFVTEVNRSAVRVLSISPSSFFFLTSLILSPSSRTVLLHAHNRKPVS